MAIYARASIAPEAAEAGLLEHQNARGAKVQAAEVGGVPELRREDISDTHAA